MCRKGEIIYGECVVCTPTEERCNYEDDDCDGLIDELQTNACGTCGPIPSEACNNTDDDCDEKTDENLIRECNTICGNGIETCESGNWISCTAQAPAEEQCDGEDNDCDGTIDEELNCLCGVEDVGNLIPCSEPPLECGQGFKTCECVNDNCSEMRMTDCAALCNYIQLPEPPICNPAVGMIMQQEQCNSFDEDCDGVLDEGLTQACYTGPPETLLVGVCSPGQVYCDNGIWGSDSPQGRFTPGLCTGEVTPQEEICDGADNDCDGVVDYGEEIRETDILFILDWSGSMDDEIAAVKIALNRFATHFAAEEPLQWGLVIGPKEFEDDGIEYLVKVSDISPFEQFLGEFAALGSDGMDTGSEMLLDAVYLSIQNISGNANVDIASTSWFSQTGSLPVKEDFNINWRPTSERIVIIFSDEEEQSFLRYTDAMTPGEPITKAVVQSAAQAGIGLKIFAFSSGGFAGQDDFWTDISVAGGGSNFELTSNAVSMYNDLMSIIDEACLPREAQVQNLSIYNNYNYASYTAGRYDTLRMVCY